MTDEVALTTGAEDTTRKVRGIALVRQAVARNTFVVSATAWTLVAILLSGLCTVMFLVNDDEVMAAFASGDFTGDPSSHLVFISIIPGVVLSRLYTLWDGVPWYIVLLYTVNVTALSTVSTVWYRQKAKLALPVGAALGVAVVAFASVIFVTPTFTTTAFAAGLAAVVLLMEAASRRTIHRCDFAAIALFVTCASLRLDAFLGTLLVAAPILTMVALRLPGRRLAALALLTMTFLGVSQLTTQLASRSDWTAYESMNEVRGSISGTRQLVEVIRNPEDPRVASMLRENDWSLADLVLFRRWFIEDPKIYNVQTISRLRTVADDFAGSNPWSDAIESVFVSNWKLAAVLASATLAACLTDRRRARLALAQLTWSSGTCVWIARTQRFPLRIALPLLLGSALLVSLSTLLFDAPSRAPARRRADRLTALGILIASALPVATAYQPFWLSSRNDIQLTNSRRNVAALQTLDPKGSFVVLGSVVAVSTEEADSAKGPYSWEGLITTGWNSQSPSQSIRLRISGLTSNLIASALDRPHVWFVGRRSDARHMTVVARTRYGLSVEAIVGTNFPGGQVAFRLVSAH